MIIIIINSFINIIIIIIIIIINIIIIITSIASTRSCQPRPGSRWSACCPDAKYQNSVPTKSADLVGTL